MENLNLTVGLLTYLSEEVAARRWRKIPSAAVVLAAGVTAYHLIPPGLGYGDYS